MASEVAFTVTGRDQGAKQTLQGAQQQASGLGRSVQRVGEIAQGIIAAQLFQKIGEGAQRFLSSARTASSDLGESMNAVNVTFENSAAGILEIGKTADSAMGLSQNAFNAAAVRFSAFAEAVAGPGGDVTKTIQDITQRSSDFASVMNLDVNEAMQTFQSGLAGESEPLRKYGIDVSAAAVNTFAYVNGIAAAGAELTEAQKIQARYGLIMEQTTQMAGDFANTSDSMANSQRILASEMENAQAIVGQLMVPALAQLNNLLIPMVQAFSDAPAPIQIVVGSLVLLGAGILTVTSRIAPMIIAMQASGISMGTLATRARSASLAMGPWVAVIGTVTAALVLFSNRSKETGNDVTGLAKDLQRFVETGRVTVEMEQLLGTSSEEFGDKLLVAGGSAKNFDGAMERLKTTWDGFLGIDFQTARDDFTDLDNAMVSVVESGADADTVLQGLIDTYGLTDAQVAKLLELLPNFNTELQRSEEAQTDAATAADSHLESLEALAEGIRAQTDPMFAFIKAQNDLRDAQKEVTQAEEDHGKKSPEYRDALRKEAEAGIAVLDAAGALGDEFTGELSAAQRKMLEDAGLSEAAIERLATDLRRAKQEADRLDGTRVRITTTELRITQHKNVFLAPSGSRSQAKAHGGITGAQDGGPRGNDVLVGEQGPEIAELPLGTRVIPSGQSMTMLANGGGGTGDVLVQVFIGERELEDIHKRVHRLALRTDDSFRRDAIGSRG